MSGSMPEGMGQHQTEVEPSEASSVRRSLVAAVVLAVAAVAAVFIVWYAGKVFLLAFAGLLFAIFLQSLSEWLSHLAKISYKVALLLVVLVLVGIAALIVWQVQSTLVQQTDQLVQTLPSTLQQVREWLQQYSWGQWVLEQFSNAQSNMFSNPAFSRLRGVASAALDFVISIVVILFVGLYGAAEPGIYRAGVVMLVPKPKRKRAQEVIDNLNYILRWWLIGKVCSMLIVGALVYAGLTLIGIRYALVLALLAALLELIPNLGPTLAALPGILLGFSQGTQIGIYVVLLYVVVQILESYVILPLIQRSTVELPPAVAILAVVLFAALAGVLGALLAAPLVVVGLVLVKMLYVRDALGDDSADLAGAPHSS